ncbi:gas vesicle protein GvpG [Hoyosella sp. YIM 151337]|uniref:gas vesicle protein GvpG n=1 Tax=Hoyosella sp. YIM 151337 TaxID=2992742 RepID=UPI002236BBC8|nr:gas vesicle protein GvpG [Hoyosella sp. YIM 151337]MCW4351787.1 gas vesicle protein GvpG [Hoyosella sp. YIM 151337]
MGLISGILGLPLLPVRGVVAVAEIIRDQVDEEMRSTGAIRRDLEVLAASRAAGEISAEQEAQAQREILDRARAPRESTPGETEGGARDDGD